MPTLTSKNEDTIRKIKSSPVQSLENRPHSLALVARVWEEMIVLHVDVALADCVEEFDLVAAEDGCESEVEFCLCETGWIDC